MNLSIYVNGPNLVYFQIKASASGDNAITVFRDASGNQVPAALLADRRLRIMAVPILIAANAVSVTFKSGSVEKCGPLAFAAAGTGVSLPEAELGYFTVEKGQTFNMNLSSAVSVGGCGVAILE